MTVHWARAIIALAGIVVWGYGFRADNGTVRLVGIALLAAALLLRFVRRRPPSA